MYKKIVLGVLTVSLGAALVAFDAYGQSTTTVQQTVTKTPRYRQKAVPARTTTTTEITTVSPGEARQVLSQDSLKKNMSTLCVSGFKAYIGNDKKNVCQGKATSPDLAFSCVWDSKGPAAYPESKKGPCSLDFADHAGKVVITKTDYVRSPPLKYGSEAECCFRAAKSPAVISGN